MDHSFARWCLALFVPAVALACGSSESKEETPTALASALESTQCEAQSFDSDIVECAATYATCVAAPNAVVATCQSALLQCMPTSAETPDAGEHRHRHHRHHGESTRPDGLALEACHAAFATCLSGADAGAVSVDDCRDTARACAAATFSAAFQNDCAKITEECQRKSTPRCDDATSRCAALYGDAGVTCE